jgi:uroporphyrin-III C-methyltransferase
MAPDTATPRAAPRAPSRWLLWLVLPALLLAALGVALVWNADERVRKVELEITRRQQDTQSEAAQSLLVSKQAQELARDTAAKVALMEARLAEVVLQRTQLEELTLSLSRSRDENVVADLDASLRLAQQQATITGSAEPLVAALKQADERLARHKQPRLDTVRRALLRDLDRVKAVAVADIASLSIKLDEAVRLVDDLPLLSQAPLHGHSDVAASAQASAVPMEPDTEPAMPQGFFARWWSALLASWGPRLGAVLSEARTLVRVTRIDHPEAALLAPEHAFFLRENFKLRLLNARLAVLSRQFDLTQTDLQAAQTMLERYFDRSSRRTQMAAELLKQVALSARSVSLPRPDDSLAALAAVAAGR